MPEHEADATLLDQMARVGQAVASSRRLELLDVLAQGERCVECLARAIQMPVNSTSNHLKVLRNANLVSARRHGTQVFYSTDSHLSALLRQLWLVAHARLPEVAQTLHENLPHDHADHHIDHADLAALRERGTVLVVDVRPVEDYRVGHLPDAVSMPFGQLAEQAADLPSAAEIVTYGRGPHSVLAARAAHLLRERGHRARALVDGFPRWSAAGLPVIASPSPDPHGQPPSPAHPPADRAAADTPPAAGMGI